MAPILVDQELEARRGAHWKADVHSLVDRSGRHELSDHWRHLSQDLPVSIQDRSFGGGDRDVRQVLDVKELVHDGEQALVVPQSRRKRRHLRSLGQQHQETKMKNPEGEEN